MPKRRGKSVSFDAMIKFFLKYYDIATKKDMNKIVARLENLEKLIKDLAKKTGRGGRDFGINGSGSAASVGKTDLTAADTVLEIIKHADQGIGFAAIYDRTGFAEKKLRNVIYRLNKLEKIKRKRRGLYVVAS